jgi:two-component system sensor histidine kinase/response regulator
MSFESLQCWRILVIDDDRGTHKLIRGMLSKAVSHADEPDSSLMPDFQIDSAYQGEEGLNLIEKSLQEKRPYFLAFVDVRMPPGWDGIVTTAKIMAKCSDLQVIICTAFSDYSWQQIVSVLGHLDRIVVLPKPFKKIDVVQLAVAMTARWQMKQESKLRMDNLEKLIEDHLVQYNGSKSII